jgi:Holliday junction DNA helicase RuvB
MPHHMPHGQSRPSARSFSSKYPHRRPLGRPPVRVPDDLFYVNSTAKTHASSTLKPLDLDERTGNALRPATFDQMVGQARLKTLMARVVANCRTRSTPLPHILLTGASGTGKTTLGQVIAHESGRSVYQVAAPVGRETLVELGKVCNDGDVIIVDEIHQQVSGDRRGVTQAADPEDYYTIMEDRRLMTETGAIKFPAVTFIGATTDEGLLPEPFLNRFPLRLTLDRYEPTDMARLARANAEALGLHITPAAAELFGGAARRNPRQTNTYVKNADALGIADIDTAAAMEVVCDLNATTLDGLTRDMQKMLVCLLRSRRESRDGRVVYQASVNTVATALGHGRDTKAIALYVEPYLIEEGYVVVTHGGRQLSDCGIVRALELSRAAG